MPRNLAEERKYSSNLELIHEAISCVKNAIEIYSHDLLPFRTFTKFKHLWPSSISLLIRTLV